MAKRYSGRLVVTVTYDDRGHYAYTISSGGKTLVPRDTIPASPRAGYATGIASDSPLAYDGVARSAISYAVDEHPDLDLHELADVDPTGAGWLISRKAPRAKRNSRPARRPAIRGPVAPAVTFNVVRHDDDPKGGYFYYLHRVGTVDPPIRVSVIDDGEGSFDPVGISRLPRDWQNAILRAVSQYDPGPMKDNRRAKRRPSRAKRNTAPVVYVVVSNRKKTSRVRGVGMNHREIIVRRKGSQETYKLQADAYGRTYDLPGIPVAHRPAVIAAISAANRR